MTYSSRTCSPAWSMPRRVSPASRSYPPRRGALRPDQDRLRHPLHPGEGSEEVLAELDSAAPSFPALPSVLDLVYAIIGYGGAHDLQLPLFFLLGVQGEEFLLGANVFESGAADGVILLRRDFLGEASLKARVRLDVCHPGTSFSRYP